ncbi:MAG: hypothetical protein PWP57_1194 [Candidatus Atribacteria bacterium]|nr:hypothetical protein [Candidatus Atribacteria bacterium]
MNSGQRDAGSLMITVIAMIFIVSIIIFAGSTLVISGSRNVHKVSDMKQAHYMAEAGIEDALSNPFVIRDALLYGHSNVTSTSLSSFQFETNKVGEYEAEAIGDSGNKKITITSTGRVKNQSGTTLAERTIVCQFELKPGSFYDLALDTAIATAGNLTSGKVYIKLDSGVNPKTDADVYSDAAITSIAGTIPGSVIAQGEVTVNNNAIVTKDVIAKGKITINNDVQVGGKVISAGSYIDINNKVQIGSDTVAYSTDKNGYAVYLGNNSTVHNIYTPKGASQVKINGSYDSIKPISSPYPSPPTPPATDPTYPVPRKTLPAIDNEIKSSWIARAQSDKVTYNGLTVGNNETITLGNAYITGDFTLGNNAQLNIKEGSVIYVTGNISIANNATVTALEADGDPKTTLISSLITNNTFDIENNSIPTSVSLVALGTGTSYLKNNSATTGAILVPNGSLEMKNNAAVHGGIFAKSIPNIGNNAEVYFNPLLNLGLPPTTTSSEALTLLEWKEGAEKE